MVLLNFSSKHTNCWADGRNKLVFDSSRIFRTVENIIFFNNFKITFNKVKWVTSLTGFGHQKHPFGGAPVGATPIPVIRVPFPEPLPGCDPALTIAREIPNRTRTRTYFDVLFKTYELIKYIQSGNFLILKI